MKHSKKGRKRKVIKQGRANITFTGKSVTSNAGMALISRSFEAFHIPDQLQTVTAELDQNKCYPTHELLQQLIALRILGGEAIQDMALLSEPALAAMFRWGSIADPTTYGRRLKEMTWRHNLELDFAARRAQARREMKPFLDKAASIKESIVDLKEELKRLKKEKAGQKEISTLTRQIKEGEKAAREQEAKAAAIDAVVFDLKAVNPNAIAKVDARRNYPTHPGPRKDSLRIPGQIIGIA